MGDVLCFRLFGPMAAWGAPGAAGGERPSGTRPGRGAVIGLLGAALGLTHANEGALLDLGAGILVASATHGARRIASDFRTAQPAKPPPRKAPPWATRREALAAGTDDPQIGMRQHVEDSLWRVFVTQRPNAGTRLDRLEQALRAPAFPLSLGRRECPLALPPDPLIVSGDLLDACRQYPPVAAGGKWNTLTEVLDRLDKLIKAADRGAYDLAWDAGFPGAPEDGFARPINDDPASREAWRFRARVEVRTRMRDAAPENVASEIGPVVTLEEFFAAADQE